MINIFDIPTSLLEEINKVISPATHIDVDGDLKHRFNSEGKLIHHTDDGIRNFHRWFGDSTVVDSQGRPKVMYHGTRRVEKETKKHDVAIQSFKNKSGLHWFADNTSVSDAHAGRFSNFLDGSTMPVYIKASSHFDNTKLPTDKVQNPHGVFIHELTTQAPIKRKSSISNFVKSPEHSDTYKSPTNHDVIGKYWDSPEQSKHFQKLGFDSIRAHMKMEGYWDSPTIGVFHSSQIKSAIGNDGSFDHPSKINEACDGFIDVIDKK